MTDTRPRRFKELDELTPVEHEARQAANRRGQPAPDFETPEFEAYRAKVLDDHGLGPVDPDDPAPEDLTPEDIAARKYSD